MHLSGAVCSALALGLPDLGYVHGTHVAERAAGLVPALGGMPGAAAGVPLLADADTGYGNVPHTVWTARRYAAVGVSGLHLEDQVQPKRCGHLPGKTLIDLPMAAAKIRAVAEAGTGLVVVARTDAYTVTGLADAIDRARAYVDAGADAVFVEGVDQPSTTSRRVHAALPGVPLVVNRSEAGGDTAADPEPARTWPPSGSGCVLHPVAALLAALHAAAQAYAAIGRQAAAPPR